MTLELRPYQRLMIDHIVGTPRCGLLVPMGMGKTVSTATAIDALSAFEDVLPVLVLAPLRVAVSVWPDEVRKWPHLRHLRVSVVTGTAAQRRAALAADADLYCMNYDNLPWLAEELGEEWPFRMVVADESTRLKSFRLRQGGKRAQALARYIHRAPRYVGLTGTPAPNGLQDLWGQAWMIDRGARLGRSFEAFRSRWFQTIQVGVDRHAVRLEPLRHAQGEIQEKLGDVCLSLDARDWFDLREPVVNVIRVQLPEKAQALYRAMEEEMFIELGDDCEIEAFDAASRTTKCLQLANGAIYTDADCSSWEVVHDAKLDALEEIVEEAAGMPVLVAYHFRSDLARLRRRFPQGRALDGQATIRAWNAGRVPILFAHPQSAGHGLNLQDGGNILAVFGHWWDLEAFQQIVERIGPTRQAQAGHNRPVFIHHIVAAGTVDEIVMRRRESKRGVQELLLEAMKQTV